MKRILCLLVLLLGITGLLTSCSNEEPAEPEEYEEPTKDYKESLKILMIGNSFSDNAIEYLYPIAKAFGIEEVRIVNLYIGGCSLETHAKNAYSGAGAYIYREVSADTNGIIKSTSGRSLISGIIEDDWDFISMQQVSGLSGVSDTYNENLTGLALYVKDNATNPNVKYVWHMTWAYQQNSSHGDFPTYGKNQRTMYEAILSATKDKVIPTGLFDYIIPAGTAVQNARTSYLGDKLTQDGYHLNDTGEFIIGLTWIMKLTGMTGEDIDIDKVPSQFRQELPNFIEAAENAIKEPYKATKSSFKEKPALPEIDLTKYELLEWTPVIGYWNSQDANNHSNLIASAGNSHQYVSTATVFSKEDIPNGSIIVLAEGWGYRPEGWVTFGEVQGSRPGTVNAERIYVDDLWWGNYTSRAFNVYEEGFKSLTGREAEAYEAFKIYVPKK